MAFFRRTVIGAILASLLLVAWSTLAPANTCDNTVLFPPPIPLGVSGGNLGDISASYCCSGTLGCLVADQNTGKQYILSNNHVLANTNLGQPGDPISQPGLADTECGHDTFHVVATLTTFIPLKFRSGNKVDAAIAEVMDGAVDSNGTISCIGALSSQVAKPKVGLAVQKSGRTSGLTQGTVAAVNVSLLVGYDVTCGLGLQVARFRKQIRIDGNFSSPGDSGSLIVTQEACPRPVALLFAGGSNPPTTFANTMKNVLAAFKGYELAVVGACTGGLSSPKRPLRTGRLPSRK